jgi:molybdopterin-guanine dinucleotide biosynthesis protein
MIEIKAPAKSGKTTLLKTIAELEAFRNKKVAFISKENPSFSLAKVDCFTEVEKANFSNYDVVVVDFNKEVQVPKSKAIVYYSTLKSKND